MTAELTASSPAILRAASGLYEVALLIRQAPELTSTDLSEYLAPALAMVARAVQVQGILAEQRKEAGDFVTATEARESQARFIQKGPDREADFLRAANSGAAIHVAQFDGAPLKKRVGDV